jgi:hypothetical protein
VELCVAIFRIKLAEVEHELEGVVADLELVTSLPTKITQIPG